MARSPPLPPERSGERSEEDEEEEDSDALFGLCLSQTLASTPKHASVVTPAVPQYGGRCRFTCPSVYCVTAPTCQGAGLAGGAQVDGSLRPPGRIMSSISAHENLLNCIFLSSTYFSLAGQNIADKHGETSGYKYVFFLFSGKKTTYLLVEISIHHFNH